MGNDRAAMLNFRFLSFFLVLFFIAGCDEPPVTRGQSPQILSQGGGARILAMGDSLLAANAGAGLSVADVVQTALGEPVVDRSMPGASILYGLPITGSLGLKIEKQFRKGNWDWIVLNGGGNDLLFGCGCHRCEGRMEWMISQTGESGEIPNLVYKLRQTGARVIYVGYLRSPGVGSAIESCRDDGDALEARIQKMADADDGLYFLSLADLVPFGDRSFHGFDMIHPSVKGSTAIGRRVASLIAGNS